MTYRELFAQRWPVMAMLHLKGNPEEDMLRRAKEEALCYLENGVEALLIENYFGSAQDCERVLAWLQKEHPQVIYGVNILGDHACAFELAERYNARFIQIDSICGHLKPKDDEKFAAALNEYRARSNAVVLGGVRFKYQAVNSGRTVEEDLLLGTQRCDAIVVTGEGTGKVTPLEKVKQFRAVIGDFPLVMGAGVKPDALRDTLAYCDGAIVGSYFKEEHRDFGDVYAPHVAAFMSEKRRCEEEFGK